MYTVPRSSVIPASFQRHSRTTHVRRPHSRTAMYSVRHSRTPMYSGDPGFVRDTWALNRCRSWALLHMGVQVLVVPNHPSGTDVSGPRWNLGLWHFILSASL